MRATIFPSFTYTFEWPLFICDWIITPQFIKQQSVCKNKAKPYQFISNQRAKIVTFFIWPRGASENIVEVKYLVHRKVGG